MTVTIKPGETVRIELEETDVAFEVSSDSEENPGAVVVSEIEGYADSSGRRGELYRFGRFG